MFWGDRLRYVYRLPRVSRETANMEGEFSGGCVEAIYSVLRLSTNNGEAVWSLCEGYLESVMRQSGGHGVTRSVWGGCPEGV